MLRDVVEVQPTQDYRLSICFDDGVSGEVDVAEIVEFEGVFAAIKNPDYFGQVRVDPDLGTVCWPNEANIDSDVLYALVTGQPVSADEERVTLPR